MLKIQFAPMPLIACQKLDWLRLLKVFELSDEPDLMFRWEYPMTKFQPGGGINSDCLDVSKVRVNEVFSEVYGYSTEAKEGWAIEKSNLTNGLKDVRLVNLDKQEKKKDYFYQKRFKGELETRLIIMNYHPVIRLDKIKSVSDDDIPGKVTGYKLIPVEVDNKIDAFCNKLKLDYGELDILEGVIIDVNPTPGDAAWVRMPLMQASEYLWEYIKRFKENYETTGLSGSFRG